MKETNQEFLNHIKNIFQDCNINFLIGSGLSTPYFSTLGSIENWLTDLEEKLNKGEINLIKYEYLKASLYKAYFDVAIKDNKKLLTFTKEVDEYKEILETDRIRTKKSKKLNNTFLSYKLFFKSLNEILYKRKSNTISKQVNIFTTNVDIFIEKIFEDLDIQFNDGFNGIFNKKFNLSNFKKSFYQKSLQYDNISEIPVFNLLKLHGSVTWKLENKALVFSRLTQINKIIDELDLIELLDIQALNNKYWEKYETDISLEDLIKELDDKENYPNLKDFLSCYEKLQIINPTKEKFQDTTFNKYYYELLRMYANELEKENTVLFVMGFSMADEHIREITKRAIKSNPTLKLFIVSYNKLANDIKDNFKSDGVNVEDYVNVEIIAPKDNFDLKMFNDDILSALLKEINKSNLKSI